MISAVEEEKKHLLGLNFVGKYQEGKSDLKILALNFLSHKCVSLAL